MIRRFLYAVIMIPTGFVLAVPKWILFGTRASRDRKKMVKLQKAQLREMRKRSSR